MDLQGDFNQQLMGEADISAYLFELSKVAPKPRVSFYKTEKGGYSEHDQFLNINVPTLRSIARKAHGLKLEEIKILLNSKFNEERLLAMLILVDRYNVSQNNREEIYQFYIDNLDQVNNWNLVDTSAHLIVGAHLLDRDKNFLFNLARSDNLWKKRIAIVSTWYFIKNNTFTTTMEIAEILLSDGHDLIHKAVGWMLREVGKKDVLLLQDFLNKFAHLMPRTMLRYSIEKFSDNERKHYLAMKMNK